VIACTNMNSTPMLDLHLTPAGSTPIFQQIVEQIALAVRRGELVPGQVLPTVRALAERLIINPNTVAKAYGELIHAGVLEAQRGRGVFVAQQRELVAAGERQRRLAVATERLMAEAVLLGASPKEVRSAVEQGLKLLKPAPTNEDSHE